jgi:hypothetical protein
VPKKARKLLERMRKSAANWKRTDLDQLYSGFGFIIKPGKKHDIVKHPKYVQLRTTLPRHSVLAKANVRQAIALIDELDRLDAEAPEEYDNEQSSDE